jgi:outer membrane protein OmpA-like peptidoglycan-associated protein
MDYLVRQGIEPARITSVGYGEDYPVATNDTADGRRLNRRVDLLLKAKAK